MSKENNRRIFTLYEYFEKRLKGPRYNTIVQDLIDDMKTDKRFKPGMRGSEITFIIDFYGCDGAKEALKEFIKCYKRYCTINGYDQERF